MASLINCSQHLIRNKANLTQILSESSLQTYILCRKVLMQQAWVVQTLHILKNILSLVLALGHFLGYEL